MVIISCIILFSFFDHVIIFTYTYFYPPQDGKTAEELANADQHEQIVSLLVRLKKVKRQTHAHPHMCTHTR